MRVAFSLVRPAERSAKTNLIRTEVCPSTVEGAGSKTGEIMRKEELIAHIGDRRRELTRWLMAALFAVAASHLSPVHADDWHLIINGKAKHLDEKPGVHYNESNW